MRELRKSGSVKIPQWVYFAGIGVLGYFLGRRVTKSKCSLNLEEKK